MAARWRALQSRDSADSLGAVNPKPGAVALPKLLALPSADERLASARQGNVGTHAPQVREWLGLPRRVIRLGSAAPFKRAGLATFSTVQKKEWRVHHGALRGSSGKGAP